MSVQPHWLRDHRRVGPARGACCPEDTYDLADTVSLWIGNHSVKTGASFTYDVTKQLYQPLQNGVYRSPAAPAVAPTPFQFKQSFALVPGSGLMYPEGVRPRRLFPGRLARPHNLTLNLGLRYDVESSRTFRTGRRRPTRTTSIRASGSRGTRRAIRNGPSAAASAASRSSTRSSPS